MNIDLTNWQLIKVSQIEDTFEGFNNEMTFSLIDGTVYYQSAYKYHYYYAYRPIVSIYESGNTQIIVPDGMNDFVEVEQTTAIKSKITNEFRGWSGNTIFELQNGQIWQQDRYEYKYMYAYRPDAAIVKVGNRNIMTVKGKSIRVKRKK